MASELVVEISERLEGREGSPKGNETDGLIVLDGLANEK